MDRVKRDWLKLPESSPYEVLGMEGFPRWKIQREVRSPILERYAEAFPVMLKWLGDHGISEGTIKEEGRCVEFESEKKLYKLTLTAFGQNYHPGHATDISISLKRLSGRKNSFETLSHIRINGFVNNAANTQAVEVALERLWQEVSLRGL